MTREEDQSLPKSKIQMLCRDRVRDGWMGLTQQMGGSIEERRERSGEEVEERGGGKKMGGMEGERRLDRRERGGFGGVKGAFPLSSETLILRTKHIE